MPAAIHDTRAVGAASGRGLRKSGRDARNARDMGELTADLAARLQVGNKIVSSAKSCPNCGLAAPPDAPPELCPSCLVIGGFSQEKSIAESKAGSGGPLHIVIPQEVVSPGAALKRLGAYDLIQKIAH